MDQMVATQFCSIQLKVRLLHTNFSKTDGTDLWDKVLSGSCTELTKITLIILESINSTSTT
jgi:hypothetical protein